MNHTLITKWMGLRWESRQEQAWIVIDDDPIYDMRVCLCTNVTWCHVMMERRAKPDTPPVLTIYGWDRFLTGLDRSCRYKSFDIIWVQHRRIGNILFEYMFLTTSHCFCEFIDNNKVGSRYTVGELPRWIQPPIPCPMLNSQCPRQASPGSQWG